MRINGFDCSVLIDNIPTEEYQATYTPENNNENANNPFRHAPIHTLTCHIVAQEDKPFAFKLDFSRYANQGRKFNYTIYTDGNIQMSKVTSMTPADLVKIEVASSKKVIENQFEERPFRFGKFTAEESRTGVIEDDANVLSQLGTLKVVVNECIILPANTPLGNGPIATNEKEKSVSEKSLKGRAVTHKTVLGDTTVVTKPAVVVKYIGPDITFIFKYLSKESLKIQGSIPRSPSPLSEWEENSTKQVTVRDDVEQMSLQQLREEIRTRRAADVAATERQSPGAEESRKRKVKHEDEQSASRGETEKKKKRLVREIETVDLTEDD